MALLTRNCHRRLSVYLNLTPDKCQFDPDTRRNLCQKLCQKLPPEAP